MFQKQMFYLRRQNKTALQFPDMEVSAENLCLRVTTSTCGVDKGTTWDVDNAK
jgi:hypothetical protein